MVMVFRADEHKTAILNLRIKPSVKDLAERIAAAEERSLAQTMERMITAEAGRRGLIDDIPLVAPPNPAVLNPDGG